jgi:hypothetical protein
MVKALRQRKLRLLLELHFLSKNSPSWVTSARREGTKISMEFLKK